MHAFPHHAGGCRRDLRFLHDNATAHNDTTSIWSQHRAQTQESEEFFTVQMDIPGVKADRVTIEEKDGEIEITAIRVGTDDETLIKIYQQVLYMSPHKTNLENAHAALTHGVLTLTIPKNLAMKEEVKVETAEVPTELADDVFRYSLDLPGIGAVNLKVSIRDDKVHLIGKRILSDRRRMLVLQRTFEVPPSMDTSQARALLQDGVFTFLAPVHEKESTSTVRNIFVEDESSIQPSIAEMKLTEDEEMANTGPEEDKKEETTRMVETVEEEENDEWDKLSDAQCIDI